MQVWRTLVFSVALSAAACHSGSYDSGTSPQPNPPAPGAATCILGSAPGLPANSVSTDFKLQAVAGANGLPSPMDLQAPSGDPRLFIAEREGRICIVQNGVLRGTAFLDISSRVFTMGEAGLLSFTFDPQYASNGFVYVHFIESLTNDAGEIVVERYKVSADPNVLDIGSVAPVIRIPHHDFTNHYGGRVAFGPDGMLYLSTGDGGNGGDMPLMNGQNAATHLGKMLRMDVSTLPYKIPGDNPIWPTLGVRNENWAIGLRNPFRYAFDGAQLYIADVGQDLFEEVDVVAAGNAGLNYGWNIMEGTHCFGAATCNMTGLTLPVVDYPHNPACAIIGGYVYRGSAIAALQGKYLFSDLCDGRVRTLSGSTVTIASTANVGSPVSFGQDGSGEIYVLTGENRVLKFVSP